MALVYVDHPELGPQKTRLSDNVAAAATSSTVENNEGFATNDYVVFGRPGEEKAEIVKLTSTTGNTTLGHTTGPVFAHAARVPTSQIKYNQIKIYSSTTEDGTYTLVTTVDVNVDQRQTVYDDTTGTSTTWYKIKYYNETTTTLSGYSSAVEGVGYTEDSLRSMTDEILEEFGDPDGEEVPRSRIRRSLRGEVRKLTRMIVKTFSDYRRQYDTQALTSGTATYDLPTRFLAFLRIDVNLTGTSATSAYKAEIESEFKGEPDSDYQTSDPRVFFRADGNTEQFGIRPTPAASGMAFMWYWDYPATMTDDDDEHGLPFGGRDILVTAVLVKLWRSKDSEKAAAYKTDLKDDLEDYFEFIAETKQYSNNRGVEVTLGEDLYD